MNERSNEDLFKEYSDPSKRNYQHMNCNTLMFRLSKGDLSALGLLKKISALGIINSSIYTYPSTLLEVIELYSRSNKQLYYDYENAKDIESRTRYCNILIYRSQKGVEDALQYLKLLALDEIIGTSSSRQAQKALDKMKKS